MVYDYDDSLDRPVWVLTTADGDWVLPPVAGRPGGFVVFTSPAAAARFVWWARRDPVGRAVAALPRAVQLRRADRSLGALAAAMRQACADGAPIPADVAAYLLDPRPAFTRSAAPAFAIDAERLPFDGGPAPWTPADALA